MAVGMQVAWLSSGLSPSQCGQVLDKSADVWLERRRQVRWDVRFQRGAEHTDRNHDIRRPPLRDDQQQHPVQLGWPAERERHAQLRYGGVHRTVSSERGQRDLKLPRFGGQVMA